MATPSVIPGKLATASVTGNPGLCSHPDAGFLQHKRKTADSFLDPPLSFRPQGEILLRFCVGRVEP